MKRALAMGARIFLTLILLLIAPVLGQEPGGAEQLLTITDLVNKTSKSLHILYIHGIGANGADTPQSHDFRENLCKRLPGCKSFDSVESTDYADRGSFAPDKDPPLRYYIGNPIWTRENRQEWLASTPFVDHYVLTWSGKNPVVVDEINWWPLVFPLKCRTILADEASLSGPHKDLLDVCSQGQTLAKDGKHYVHYDWIQKQKADQLKAMPLRAAKVNRKYKNELLDWGFTDALLSEGAVGDLMREAVRQLFFKSAKFRAAGEAAEKLDLCLPDREFVIVSHSLGSFLAFSTLTGSNHLDAAPTENNAGDYVLERTPLMYFFANQIALLETAKISENREESIFGKIAQWKNLRQAARNTCGANVVSARTQIVAFSDPSDFLTFHVPDINDVKGIDIKNNDVQNAAHVLWFIEFPGSAHNDYARNTKGVWKVLMPTSATAGR